ncbi:MAG TPA: hypothetical protein VE935_07605 [Burkholderiales bacterium]|nr:hypothetical protein [Burkholderiales bacterium]
MDTIEATDTWAGAYLEWIDDVEQEKLNAFREAMHELAARLLEDEREALDGVAAELHSLEARIRSLGSAAQALS